MAERNHQVPTVYGSLSQSAAAREAMVRANLGAWSAGAASKVEPSSHDAPGALGYTDSLSNISPLDLWRRLPRPVKYGAVGVTLLAAAACSGGGAKATTDGERNAVVSPTSTPKPEAPTATATAEPVTLNPDSFPSQIENALRQISPKTRQQLENSPSLTPTEIDILNIYNAGTNAALLEEFKLYLEGKQERDGAIRTFNGLGVTALRISLLYCKEPKPALAQVYHSIKSFVKQEVDKWVARGQLSTTAWNLYERTHYTPPCPIPQP